MHLLSRISRSVAAHTKKRLVELSGVEPESCSLALVTLRLESADGRKGDAPERHSSTTLSLLGGAQGDPEDYAMATA